MREVAIVGAGELGGMIAYAIARRDIAGTVRLVDDHGRVAEGKALDIAEAAPLAGFATTVVGSRDVVSAGGADVIVIADRAAGGPWQGDEALTLLQRIDRVAPRAVLVAADAAHVELVERGVREIGVPRTRLFGSAPEALVTAAIAIVALELDASPRDVSLAILGVPPAHIVVGWEAASVAGFALTRLVAEPVRRQLAKRIDALWPMGPYALASAACQVVTALASESRRAVTCLVGADDSTGRRARASAAAVRLGRSGIVDTLTPSLSVAERVALETAVFL